MTCGFFIVCMPCLPKILQETGIWRGLKRRFGSTTAGSGAPKNSYYGSGIGSTVGKLPSKGSNAYSMLDEDGMPMGDLKATESTEQLRRDKMAPSGTRIVRTTRITVDEAPRDGNHSSSDTASYHKGSNAAWAV